MTLEPPPIAPRRPPEARFALAVVRSEYFVLVLTGLGSLVFAAMTVRFDPFDPGFLSPANVGNLLMSCLPLLVLATGQTFVLIAGGIDLSATALVGLSSVAGALVMNGDHGWMKDHAAATPFALAAMFGVGALGGFLNGACIAWLRMPPFMVTLTLMMFFGGGAVWAAQLAVQAENIGNLPPGFLALGSQAWSAVLLAAGLVLMAHVVLSRTLLGRWLYMTGHNPRTALISGVPVGAVTVSAYVLSGVFAAAAAVLMTARLETGSPAHGKSLLLDVIGATVIGGTSLFGGKGKALWTVFGVLFLAVLGSGLNYLNVSDFVITMIKGLVILTAALLDVWRSSLALPVAGETR